MSRTRMVSGGGRAVEVEPERLTGWFERFAGRHDGALRTTCTTTEVAVVAADVVTATVGVPFPPLSGAPAECPGLVIEPLLDHVRLPRRIGLVLVRLGGHSVGVAEGSVVVVSRTDRSAAGGWSQQRFARRREGQARQALSAAIEDTVAVLGPQVSDLDAVVLGGDPRALDVLRADRRLASVMALASPRVLDVGELRREVLAEAARRAVAVEIVVREPR